MMKLSNREISFVYFILQAAENADKTDLAEHPVQYVAHFKQMHVLLGTEFKGLTQKLKGFLNVKGE
jgi:hypothetical protein